MVCALPVASYWLCYWLLNSVEGEREKALEWLSMVRYGDHHDDVKASRFPGTGE